MPLWTMLAVLRRRITLESYSNDAYGDTSPDVVIDIDNYTAGENYFLYIDGNLVNISEPSSDEQAAKQMILTDIDVAA